MCCPAGHATGVPGASPTSLGERAAAALEAHRAGDSAPLTALVREATPMLWHVARAQGAGRQDAEDVVQGVWLAFVRNVAAIREPEALLGWLVVSTRRSAWQVVRRRREEERRTQAIPEDLGRDDPLLADPAPAPDVRLLTVERDRVLWSRFAELSERCRRILTMVAMADRPDYRAIAELTGMPVTSVGVTRGRCLAKLRRLLDADERWVEA
ncbi:RNA polymerase sigma factor [Actinotalea sp.]|uniref:RNA polymerase sigma factor n=1 Tax=Actinotalea sp. TaxID=1872145 RepID=UPI00356A1785